MPMIIDATTGLPGYSFFEDAIEETLAELMAEGDPETPSPVREPGEPLADPEEPEDDDDDEDEADEDEEDEEAEEPKKAG